MHKKQPKGNNNDDLVTVNDTETLQQQESLGLLSGQNETTSSNGNHNYYGDDSAQSTSTSVVPSNQDENVNNIGIQDEEQEIALVEKYFGRLLLLLVAFSYGTLNVVLRWVYELPGPPSASALSSSRGWMALFCFAPLLLFQNKQQQASTTTASENDLPLPPMWKISLELAIFNFAAQALLTLGLLTLESARASFLTQCSVVITPVISAMAGQKVPKIVWFACVVALCGLALLSNAKSKKMKNYNNDDDEDDDDDLTGTTGQSLFHFSVGDLIVLAGAVCWSIYVFRLSSVGQRYNEILLQARKTFYLAILYSVWYAIAQWQSEKESLWPGYNSDWEAWVLIFYSALVPGTLADVIQQKGQSKVAATESNIILSMEPVFTAILGRLLLGEATTAQEKFGGGLILIAALMAS